MIYRNGIKEYTMTTLFFGVPMGLLYGLIGQSVLFGGISGIFCGSSFTLLIFLFVKIQEKKYARKRSEISKERKIICDGGANVQGNGGWMFFTEYGLEFYPHKFNISQKGLMIPVSEIEWVKTNKNQIIVETIEKATHTIVVSHNKEWVEQIKKVLIK